MNKTGGIGSSGSQKPDATTATNGSNADSLSPGGSPSTRTTAPASGVPLDSQLGNSELGSEKSNTSPADQVSHHRIPASFRPVQNPQVPYTADALSSKETVLYIAFTACAAFFFTVLSWLILANTNLPAYSGSFVTQAVATAGTVLLLLIVCIVLYYWLHPPKDGHKRLTTIITYGITYLTPAGLVITSLGIPLSATRLYLDGISIDQGFRTQYLTRMTDSLGFYDMNYPDIPSFYPGLWFFSGGLFARITGMEGWAAFKPWSLITLAVSCSILVPVWQRITGSLVVSGIVVIPTTLVTLTIAPEEPYAAIVAVAIPIALILGQRALTGGTFALWGVGVYLGLSANLYTLFTAVTAISIAAMALFAAINMSSLKPFIRLLYIGLISGVLALLGWGPYLYRLITTPPDIMGRSQHYLPQAGTEIPFPFAGNTAILFLTIVAIIWIVIRFRDSDVRALAVGLLVFYAWVILSMLTTLLGTTLLGFRLALPILLIFTTAGALAICEARLYGLPRLYPQVVSSHNAKVVSRIVGIFLAISLIIYATDIPQAQRDQIDLAYTDTDGEGVRGDLFPADAATYYKDIDTEIKQHFPDRKEAVLLTDEKNFLAYYPYFSFQAMTAHYANPLGQFEKRNEEIESWTQITSSSDLLQALDQSEHNNGWKTPNVMIFRGELQQSTNNDPYGTFGTTDNSQFSYLIADDIYPNSPNVRFRTVYFSASAFDQGWYLQEIGPFVIAIRTDNNEDTSPDQSTETHNHNSTSGQDYDPKNSLKIQSIPN